jgi:hypothetical protein
LVLLEQTRRLLLQLTELVLDELQALERHLHQLAAD